MSYAVSIVLFTWWCHCFTVVQLSKSDQLLHFRRSLVAVLQERFQYSHVFTIWIRKWLVSTNSLLSRSQRCSWNYSNRGQLLNFCLMTKTSKHYKVYMSFKVKFEGFSLWQTFSLKLYIYWCWSERSWPKQLHSSHLISRQNCHQTDLPARSWLLPSCLQVWFSNRRAKWRKQEKVPPVGSPTAASPAQTVPTTFINSATGYPTTVISPPPNHPTPVHDESIPSHQYPQVHDVSLWLFWCNTDWLKYKIAQRNVIMQIAFKGSVHLLFLSEMYVFTFLESNFHWLV